MVRGNHPVVLFRLTMRGTRPDGDAMQFPLTS
jgi:hypothetical protein